MKRTSCRKPEEEERKTPCRVDVIAAVSVSDALEEQQLKSEAKRENLLSMQNVKPVNTIVNYAEVSKRIRQYATNLKTALNDVQQARKILSELMGTIEIKVKEDGIYAEYDCATERLFVCGGAYIPVVAGAGFEPTTFGL